MNDTPTIIELFHAVGFTENESMVLECLKKGSATQDDIQYTTNLCQCGISQILKGLIKKGCVEVYDTLIREGRGRPKHIYYILMVETLNYAEKQIVDKSKDIERLKELAG